MGFGNCILKCLNLEDSNLLLDYKMSLFGDKGGYIEGVLNILDIKNDIIAVKIKNAKLNIYGDNLKVKSYFEKDLSILGKITKVEYIK